MLHLISNSIKDCTRNFSSNAESIFHDKILKGEHTFSFKSSEASMLPLVSGKCTELDAMLACSWRDEYISKTVSRRNLSAPWNVINETEIGQSLCFPKGMETCQ